MSDNLITIVRSEYQKKGEFFLFFPALAVEIGLNEGIPLETPIVKRVTTNLKKKSEQGYLRWNKDYPYDYDYTITSRNVLGMLNQKEPEELRLSWAKKKGGVYTYVGGKQSKANNSVDLLINLRILKYLKRNNLEEQKLYSFLKNNKQKFFQEVKTISKYYKSEGYLLYLVSKVSKDLDVNIDQLIKEKIKKIKNQTDLGLAILSSDLINSQQYKNSKQQNLELFWHPRLKHHFSCGYFDNIIKRCVEQKLSQKDIFDEFTAEVYNNIGKELYNYYSSAVNLQKLLQHLKISRDTQLVELGVGTGNFLEKMSEHGYNILGVDISEEMLKKARQITRNNHNITLKQLDCIDFLLDKKAKVIYTKNFIDLYSNSTVEFWAESKEKSNKLLKNINTNLQQEGYFFLPKKQDKKINGNEKFILNCIKESKGSQITNTYLYQDKNFTLRKTYTKTGIPYSQFLDHTRKLGWIKERETKYWIIFKKGG